jgi:hypothetical protein
MDLSRNQPRKRPGEPMTLDYFKSRSVVDGESGCWLWQHSRNRGGYGGIKTAGRNRPAHRVAFEIVSGQPVPPGLDVCHKCDVRNCVNPEHLFVGTRAENMADCARKGRGRKQEGRGDTAPAAKLTSAAVLEIRRSFLSASQLAQRFGVHKSTVLLARVGRTWGHI